MKNLTKAVLTVLAFTLVFSTWSLADGAPTTKRSAQRVMALTAKATPAWAK